MRLLAGVAAGLLVLCSCTGTPTDDELSLAPSEPTSSAPSDSGENTESEPETTAPSTPSTPAQVDPVSLPALMTKEYDGRGLRLGEVREQTASYTSYQTTYRGDGLTLSGVLNVPRGKGPFPAVVLAHGYIDPAVYRSGQGMTRERGVLADAGYIAFHVDYRNHGTSDRDPDADLDMRLGYTTDVINAVAALRRWDGPVDVDRIGLVGRSMGGGVVYNVLTVMPGLVRAGVVFAPVSSRAVDSYNRWVKVDRPEVAAAIVKEHGEPGPGNGFWRGVSARTYFDRIAEPLMIHHGTLDDTCPIRWSEETVNALRRAGKTVRYHVYPGEQHAFGPQFNRAMQRTIAFLDRNL
ncbi:alpha/beta hydrolase family protein [Nocardioides sp. Bht2]|uniref:alpha/beta hydrolase family protein n=1 Tax=Nocardioides sp. Bht2 TaxID=3392297 RepID=UPI0039B44509